LQAARERHARERLERVKQSLSEVAKAEEKKAKTATKRKDRPARAAMIDPEARNTKPADGGFRPTYKGQLNVDIGSRMIVGV
jgi:hypothetical protein